MAENIKCPACGSEITSDGVSLLFRSEGQKELEKLAKLSPKAQSEILRLEKIIEKLRREKGESHAVVEEVEKPGPVASGGPAGEEQDEDDWV